MEGRKCPVSMMYSHADSEYLADISCAIRSQVRADRRNSWANFTAAEFVYTEKRPRLLPSWLELRIYGAPEILFRFHRETCILGLLSPSAHPHPVLLAPIRRRWRRRHGRAAIQHVGTSPTRSRGARDICRWHQSRHHRTALTDRA